MNIYVYPIFIGAILLMVPQAAWAGLGLIAMGGVLYGFSQRDLQIAQQPPKYMSYLQPRPQSGVSWSVKDQYRENAKQMRDDLTGESNSGPHIKDGMFNLPVPMENEVGQLMDVNYRVPTKAKGFTQEKEKTGNPWLPGF